MAVAPEGSGNMEVSGGALQWSSEKFLEMRQQFVQNRSETTALDILQRLVALSPDDVDESAWLDCKDLIILLLENIPVPVLITTQQVLLLNAIEHSPARVVSLLANFFAEKQQATPLLGGAAVAIAIAFARRINDTTTFEAISHLLSPVATQSEVLTELLHQLNGNKDSEHRFRIYQVLLCCLQIKTYSPVLLPILEQLTAELEGNDVLSQLSAMDILSEAAVANTESATLLTQSGITQKIYDTLLRCRDSPDGGFLFSSCIKFFGSLCHCYPEAITAFPTFIPLLFNMVRNYDVLDASQRMLAIETFAHVAFTVEAKAVLAKQTASQTDPNMLPSVVESFTGALGSGPVEMRARVLDAFALVLQNGTEEQLSLWFSWMPDLPSILSAYVMRPFPELRLAAIRTLAVVLRRPFGVEAMLTGSRDSLESFKDWLCDPKSESEWEASRDKAQLVRGLLAANWPCVGPPLAARLRGYFQATRPETEVATMEL